MRKPAAAPPALMAALAAEDWRAALAIAARFRHLGPGKPAVLRAWNALQRPAFYREIGHDPDALLAEGVRVLLERFSPATNQGQDQ